MANTAIIEWLQKLWLDSPQNFPDHLHPGQIAQIIQDDLRTRGIADASRVQTYLSVLMPEIDRLVRDGYSPEEISNFTDFNLEDSLSKLRASAGGPVREGAGEIRADLMPTIQPPDELLTEEHFGRVDDDQYWESFRKLENKVEARLHETRKDYEYDPFYMQVSKLLPEEREPILREIDELTGVRGLLAKDVGPSMFRDYVNRFTGMAERSPAGRFRVDPSEFMKSKINPRALYLARSTVRYDSAAGFGDAVINRYASAGTVLRPMVQQHIQDLLESKVKTAGKTLIFDVETPGLNKEEGIWQLAARLVDEEGNTVKDLNLHFKNPKMMMQGMGPNGMSLQDWLSAGHDVNDYPEGLMDFFGMVKDADWIGGHNIFFDYGMISHGLAHHPLYSADTDEGRAFKEGVDLFKSKFWDESANRMGKVVDTHALAQTLLSDIGLAPELKGTETPYQFSLQNILLRTDLVERAKKRHGNDVVSEWLSRGLHYADVDVPFEVELKLALQEKAQGGRGLKYTDKALTAAERHAVLSSKAVGPNIEISDLSLIDPGLLRRFDTNNVLDQIMRPDKHGRLKASLPKNLRGDEDKLGDLTRIMDFDEKGQLRRVRLTPLEQMATRGRRYSATFPEVAVAAEAPKPFRKFFERVGKAADTDFAGVNPSKIKEALLDTFWRVNPHPERTTQELGWLSGTWNHYAQYRPGEDKGFVRTDGRLAWHGHTPQFEEFQNLQKEWGEAGVPLSGMSWIERHLASTLSTSGKIGIGTAEKRARDVYGSFVAPVSHFTATEEVKVVGKSRIAQIPEWVLREAQEAGVFGSRTAIGDKERAQFYYLSPFEWQNKANEVQHEVGLMFEFAKDGAIGNNERRNLLAHLQSNQKRYGIDDDTLKSLEKSFEDRSGKYGIQVGTYGNFADQGGSKTIYNAIQDVTGGRNVDDLHSRIYVASLTNPLELTEEESRKHVYTGGVFMRPDLLDKEQDVGKAIPAELRNLSRVYKESVDEAGNNRMMSFFSSVSGRVAGEDTKLPMKMFEAYSKVRRRGPLIALGAAVLGSGYYLHRRHVKNKEYDETNAIQPFEDDGWYQRYRDQMASNSSPGYVEARTGPKNPLSTANIVRSLDRMKVGHTAMGANKYGYLFSTSGI